MFWGEQFRDGQSRAGGRWLPLLCCLLLGACADYRFTVNRDIHAGSLDRQIYGSPPIE